jgi:hypothetical protein
MKVQITVTADDGRTFTGEIALAGSRGGSARRGRSTPPAAAAEPAGNGRIDFGLPVRAFLKKHATGGGPNKFAVLLARMTKGKTDVEVTREHVEREWNRNKGVLGVDYHTMYGTRSAGNGWTDSPKRGVFVLRPEWRAALR